MDAEARLRRNARIAEIARDILSETHPILAGGAGWIDAAVVKAVDDARRAEYYERLELREGEMINR